MNTERTPKKPSTDDALLIAKGVNQAIALLDTELGDDRGADYPAMSPHKQFLNRLRYTLLNHLPSEYCAYFLNPSDETTADY